MKTIEEILYSKFGLSDGTGIRDIVQSGIAYDTLESAMIEYAEEVIERCAEVAKLKDSTPEIPYNNWVVDTKSILKVKEELK